MARSGSSNPFVWPSNSRYTHEVHQWFRGSRKPAFLDVFAKCQRVPPSPPHNSVMYGKHLRWCARSSRSTCHRCQGCALRFSRLSETPFPKLLTASRIERNMFPDLNHRQEPTHAGMLIVADRGHLERLAGRLRRGLGLSRWCVPQLVALRYLPPLADVNAGRDLDPVPGLHQSLSCAFGIGDR